jgi:hypothetical protein
MTAFTNLLKESLVARQFVLRSTTQQAASKILTHGAMTVKL